MFRKHGLGTFSELLIRVTRDPAMLLWLSGSENTKESPNENYARELMELFTLGADRGYTEDDVREQARALTGFQHDYSDGSRAAQLPLRSRAARHGPQEGAREEGQLRLAGLVQAVPGAQQPPVVLRREAVVVLHPGAARKEDAARAAAPVHTREVQGAARAGGDPEAPELLPRPAHGEAAGRVPRGTAARHAAGRRHRRLGLAVGDDEPAALLPAERRRLGGRPLARHRLLARALADRRRRRSASTS